MKIFKDFKLNWWQIGLFKLSLFSVGVIFGVHFVDFFGGIIPFMWILFLVPGVYLLYVWLKQKD